MATMSKKKLKEQKPGKIFDSQFMNQDLKMKIDTVNNTNFLEVKAELATFIRENFKTAERDLKRLAAKNNPFQLQKFYYDYILASTGNKVVTL